MQANELRRVSKSQGPGLARAHSGSRTFSAACSDSAQDANFTGYCHEADMYLPLRAKYCEDALRVHTALHARRPWPPLLLLDLRSLPGGHTTEPLHVPGGGRTGKKRRVLWDRPWIRGWGQTSDSSTPTPTVREEAEGRRARVRTKPTPMGVKQG